MNRMPKPCKSCGERFTPKTKTSLLCDRCWLEKRQFGLKKALETKMQLKTEKLNSLSV